MFLSHSYVWLKLRSLFGANSGSKVLHSCDYNIHYSVPEGSISHQNCKCLFNLELGKLIFYLDGLQCCSHKILLRVLVHKPGNSFPIRHFYLSSSYLLSNSPFSIVFSSASGSMMTLLFLKDATKQNHLRCISCSSVLIMPPES